MKFTLNKMFMQVNLKRTNLSSEISMSDQAFGYNGKNGESCGGKKNEKCWLIFILLHTYFNLHINVLCFCGKFQFHHYKLITYIQVLETRCFNRMIYSGVCRNNVEDCTCRNHYVHKSWQRACWYRWHIKYC